jgi:hypothetical protein
MWSSLFFVALLLLLENLREGRRWAQFALPPFMLLWANLHAGYILGMIVIVIAAAAAHLARHVARKRILVSAAAAIALTGCNPAGYEALLYFAVASRIKGIFRRAIGVSTTRSGAAGGQALADGDLSAAVPHAPPRLGSPARAPGRPSDLPADSGHGDQGPAYRSSWSHGLLVTALNIAADPRAPAAGLARAVPLRLPPPARRR